MKLSVKCWVGCALMLLVPVAAKAELVGYWSFDDASGTMLADTSGHGNNGTLSGTSALPTWVAGHTGAAGDYSLAFTGGSGSTQPHVQLGNPADLKISGDQTISMWLYPTDIGGGVRRNPYAKAYGGSGTLNLFSEGFVNYYYGTNGGNGAPFQSFGSPVLTNNAWHHVTIVRDLSDMTLTWYVNGGSPTSRAANLAPATVGNNPAYFGRGYMSNWLGLIDNASIWNEALDRREVIALRNDAYTPAQLDRDIYQVDVAGYTYSATPNAHSDYYKDEGKDGGSPTGDLTDGPYVYVGQSPAPDDGTVGWMGTTPVDIIFDLGGLHQIDKVLIGYSYWHPSSNGAPDDVQIALSTDGVFDTETFTTYTGFDGTDFRNELFLDLGGKYASHVMLRFDGGATGGRSKYLLDEVAFFAVPEPASGALLGIALLGMAVAGRRGRRRA